MQRAMTKLILIVCTMLSLGQCAFFLNEDSHDPLIRQTEDGLPVFYIHTAPGSVEYCPGILYYRGREYQIEGKIRGASSRYYPMKSYTIKFCEDQLFSDPEFGFDNERKIVLITSFNDNSFIRNRLGFDIWNSMDNGHIRIKTYSAVVYLNGKYWGLYTVSEHINAFLMAEHGLSSDGNLYKTRSPAADFFIKEDLHRGFEKTEGYPEDGDAGAYADLDELVTFISTAEPDVFTNTIDSILNKREYEAWWMFVMLLRASDSCAKNAFHYHKPGSSVWRYIPWDLNSSFGQNSKTKREGSDVLNNYFGLNNIFKRFHEEDDIRNPLQTRFYTLLSPENELDINRILSKIDEYTLEIREAALKSEEKWKDKYRDYVLWKERTDFTTFDEEIQYIKDWITNRHLLLINAYSRYIRSR